MTILIRWTLGWRFGKSTYQKVEYLNEVKERRLRTEGKRKKRDSLNPQVGQLSRRPIDNRRIATHSIELSKHPKEGENEISNYPR